MTRLLGRVLDQTVEYIHCWWSWGQWDEEKKRWIGAVGKVTFIIFTRRYFYRQLCSRFSIMMQILQLTPWTSGKTDM